MYVPKCFEEHDRETIVALIGNNPLVTLVTSGSNGLNVNHLPFVFLPEQGRHGVLRAHVPQFNLVVDDARAACDAVAVFHGPQTYISPGWYATKARDARVVPTWNYQVVHVLGKMRLVEDRQFVRSQIEALTRANEQRFSDPWSVSDAPDDYIEKMLKPLVGLELSIDRIVAKTKASQNHPLENRLCVIEGLREVGSDNALAMAALVPGN